MNNNSYVEETIHPPLLHDLLNKNIIPVIGAGFSRNAEGIPNNQILPTWHDLGKEYAKLLKEEYDNEPINSISKFEKKYGRNKLIEYLNIFLHKDIAKPGDVHKNFAKLHFDTIITTNYDRLLEDTYYIMNKKCKKICDSKDLALFNNEEIKIIKIHGDLERYDSIIITKEDYDKVGKNSLYKNDLKYLINAKSLVFIGYSFEDPDLKKIIKEVHKDIKPYEPPLYAILINADKDTLNFFETENVTVTNISDSRNHKELLSELFDQLYKYIEKETRRHTYENIGEEIIHDLKEIQHLRNDNDNITNFNNLDKNVLDILLEVFSKFSDIIKIPYEMINSISSEKTSGYISLEKEFFIYGLICDFANSKRSLIEKSDAYQKFKATITEDYYLKKQINEYYQFFGLLYYLSDWSCLSHILIGIIYSMVTNKNENIINLYKKLYGDLEYFLKQETIPIVLVSPLYNFFITGCDSIRLDAKTSIRKISGREQIRLMNLSHIGENGIYGFENAKFLIEYKSEIEKSNGDRYKPTNIYAILESVITALRLFKRGQVGIYSLSRLVSLDVPLTPANLVLSIMNLGTSNREYYTFEESEVKEFIKFWKKYNKSLVYKIFKGKDSEHYAYINIKTSMRSFLSSYVKKNTIDAYIDLTRSLIGIFISDSELLRHSEKNIIKRCIRFLEFKGQMKKELEGELKVIFNKFNKIISGQLIEQMNIISLENIVKKCIIKYLDKMGSESFSHKALIKSLD